MTFKKPFAKKSFALLLLVFCAGALAGCMPMTSKEPPPTIYILRPLEETTAKSSSREKPSKVLVVREPQVPQGFRTDQIALYLQGGRQLDYYANARWSATLDEVLQDMIVQSARHAWPNVIAATPDFGAPASYRLLVRVADFEPVYDAGPDRPPDIRISLAFTLVAAPEGRVLADFRLAATRRAKSNTMTSVIAGMEEALQDMLAEAFRTLRPVM